MAASININKVECRSGRIGNGENTQKQKVLI